MKTPTAITAILNKPMDRGEFLKHIGVAVLLAVGGGMIMQALGGMKKLGLEQNAQQSSLGYGSSAYGGQIKG